MELIATHGDSANIVLNLLCAYILIRLSRRI